MFGVGLGVGRRVGCHHAELPLGWWGAMLGVSLKEVTPATCRASGGRGLNAQPEQTVLALVVSVEAWLSAEGHVGVPRPESYPT